MQCVVYLLALVPSVQSGVRTKKYYNKFNKDFKNGPHKKIFKNVN